MYGPWTVSSTSKDTHHGAWCYECIFSLVFEFTKHRLRAVLRGTVCGSTHRRQRRGIVAPPCRKNVNMTFKEGALCVCVCLWTKQAHYYTLRMIRPLKTWGRSWPCVSSLASLTYKGRDSQSVQHTVCSARKSHCWIWWKQWKSGKQYEFATYLWCQCKAVLLKC